MSNSLTSFSLPSPASKRTTDRVKSTEPSVRVSFIIQLLRDRYQNSNSPWTVIQLIPGDFELLMDFAKTDKASCDFFQQFRYGFITATFAITC